VRASLGLLFSRSLGGLGGDPFVVKEKIITPFNAVGVVTAAGAGVRMGSDLAKQFLELQGKPILTHTLEKFQSCPDIREIIVVVPEGSVDFCLDQVVKPYGLSKVSEIVVGGERRQDSVRMGIEATRGDFDLVAVHDGVRPFVTPELISRIVAAAAQYGAATAGLRARETVKEVDGEGWVIRTHDRRRLWMIQTPQVFRYRDIVSAHRRAQREGWEDLTDDALLMERMGIPVKVIEGSEENIKITTPKDLLLGRFFVEAGTGFPQGGMGDSNGHASENRYKGKQTGPCPE